METLAKICDRCKPPDAHRFGIVCLERAQRLPRGMYVPVRASIMYRTWY